MYNLEKKRLEEAGGLSADILSIHVRRKKKIGCPSQQVETLGSKLEGDGFWLSLCPSENLNSQP